MSHWHSGWQATVRTDRRTQLNWLVLSNVHLTVWLVCYNMSASLSVNKEMKCEVKTALEYTASESCVYTIHSFSTAWLMDRLSGCKALDTSRPVPRSVLVRARRLGLHRSRWYWRWGARRGVFPVIHTIVLPLLTTYYRADRCNSRAWGAWYERRACGQRWDELHLQDARR